MMKSETIENAFCFGERTMKTKALTPSELVVVVVIMVFLAAVLMPGLRSPRAVVTEWNRPLGSGS